MCLRDRNRYYWNEEYIWGIRFKIKILNLYRVQPNDVELWKPECVFFFLPNSIFGHKKWCLLLLFCFHFHSPLLPPPPPPPPNALKRKAEGKRACPSSWSTEKETLFDDAGFLGLGSRPVLLPLSGTARPYSSGNSTDPYPAQFSLASSFLEDLTRYRLSFSNLSTEFSVARNRWLRRTGCNRLMVYLAPFQEEKP